MTKRLLIVGGGPAGCAAALKAAQAGLEVTLYERGDLGGVCLHAGCIPAKALLQASPETSNCGATPPPLGFSHVYTPV